MSSESTITVIENREQLHLFPQRQHVADLVTSFTEASNSSTE